MADRAKRHPETAFFPSALVKMDAASQYLPPATWRLTMRYLIVASTVSACAFCAQAQKQQLRNKQPSQAEKEWCPTIEVSLAEAVDLQPPMRTLVLELISQSLKKCHPSALRRVLIDAFTTTVMIPETEEDLAQRRRANEPRDQTVRVAEANLEAKRLLQTEVLMRLIPVDETKVETLLPKSEPSVRARVLRQMISNALSAEKLDYALKLLKRVPDRQFPYGEATNLMLALPPTREADRRDIFQRAMAADRDYPSLVVGGDDFASMIVRFWKHEPPAVVLQAISQVLDEAQPSGEEISLSSGAAKTSFSNEYEYRVFELLPVLRQIDGDEADKILRRTPAVETKLAEFPSGIQSLNPAIRDTPLKKGETSSLNGIVGTGVGSVLQESDVADAYESRVSEIVRIADNDLSDGIQAAAGLPKSVGSVAPRADALLKIAQLAITKHHDSAGARDAIEGLPESLENVRPTDRIETVEYWAQGVEMASQIGEFELAKRLLRDGAKEIEKLKSKDTDSNDPNLALKAWWPSSAALSRLMLAASSISPRTALESIGYISDPEVRIVCQVRLANQELGVGTGQAIIMVRQMKSAWAEYHGVK